LARQLIGLLLLLGVAAALSGCDSQAGPNDPVVSGKKLNELSRKNMTPEEIAAAKSNGPQPGNGGAGAPGAGPGASK
jgi:hypothetical protein